MKQKTTLNDIFTSSVKKYSESYIKTSDPNSEGNEYVKSSYKHLEKMVLKLTSSLRQHGVEKGDKVAVIGKPHPRWAAALFATLRVGATIVPIDSDLTSSEVRRILHESECKLVFVQGQRKEVVSSNFSLLPRLDNIVSYSGEPEEPVSSWDDFLSAGDGSYQLEHTVQPTDIAAIMYTSGTTGNAKGVVITHQNFISNIKDIEQVLEVGITDTLTSILPWHHIYGLTSSLLLSVHSGASFVYTEDYRNLPQVLKDNDATFLLGVPKLFNAIFKEIKHEIESSFLPRVLYRYAPLLLKRSVRKKFAGNQFRSAVSGGAPLDPETAVGFRRLGLGMIEGYGLTETSPVLTMTPDPFTDKKGTVGQPLPSVQVKLSGSEKSDVREVLVKGPNVMKGYYKNPEKTREVFDKDGWFKTGDSGRLDEDNWLYLNGRKKNVIVLESGKNVYPEEVEWEIGRLPFIDEVLVKEKKRRGRPVVSAAVYPEYEALAEEGITSKKEIQNTIWKLIRDDCQDLARYKRIKSKQDLEIMEEPFEKTPTLKVKRYLYKDKKVAES